MLQRVWEQLGEAGIAGQAVITAGSEQVELIKSQVKEARIAVEPGRRDTFAAVLLSCSWLLKHGASREDYAAIMPVDPYTEGSYFETVKKLEAIMRESGAEVGLMGAAPSYPATKYGYILPGEKKDGWFKVRGFAEKPDEEKAEALLKEGALWNCGVFCVKIGDILERTKKYGVPEDYDALCAAYESLPKISFDYEVLEKAEHLAAVEFDGYWKDLGNLGRPGRPDEHRHHRKCGAGRHLREHPGHQRTEDARGCHGNPGSGGGGRPGRHSGGRQEPDCQCESHCVSL